jgi:hypothetical protein
VTRNERRRGQRPGLHDQLSATHNERRIAQRPGRHKQVPATLNERRRWQRRGNHEQVENGTDSALENFNETKGTNLATQSSLLSLRVAGRAHPKKKPNPFSGCFLILLGETLGLNRRGSAVVP